MANPTAFVRQAPREELLFLLFSQCIRTRFDFGQRRHTLNPPLQKIQANKLKRPFVGHNVPLSEYVNVDSNNCSNRKRDNPKCLTTRKLQIENIALLGVGCGFEPHPTQICYSTSKVR